MLFAPWSVLAYVTSFYVTSMRGGVAHALRDRTLPLITRYQVRWRWLETSVVPRLGEWMRTRA